MTDGQPRLRRATIVGAGRMGVGIAENFLWGGLTMGMMLCIPLMLAGIGLLTYTLTRQAKSNDG